MKKLDKFLNEVRLDEATRDMSFADRKTKEAMESRIQELSDIHDKMINLNKRTISLMKSSDVINDKQTNMFNKHMRTAIAHINSALNQQFLEK